jgi:hypothetical protein
MVHEEKVYTSGYEMIYAAENRHKGWQQQNTGKERGAMTKAK